MKNCLLSTWNKILQAVEAYKLLIETVRKRHRRFYSTMEKLTAKKEAANCLANLYQEENNIELLRKRTSQV